MPSPSDLQKQFAGSLLDASGDVPGDLTSVTQSAPKERFNIYRNNVHVSLIDALGVKYPAVHRIVGGDFFRGLARTYIRAHPPKTPLIIYYGQGFADFLEIFEHVQDLPYLPDIARLEWSRIEAYHAADMISLGAQELADIDKGRLGGTVFELHPSLRLLKSKYPVVSIWQANIDEQELSSLDTNSAREDALIIRPLLDVEVLKLPSSACDFVVALRSGINLEEANALALERDGRFDLQLVLQGLIQCGAFVGFSD